MHLFYREDPRPHPCPGFMETESMEARLVLLWAGSQLLAAPVLSMQWKP